MPKHAVTAPGEAMPAGNILMQLSDMLKSGDVQGAIAVLDANQIVSPKAPTPTKKPTDHEIIRSCDSLMGDAYDLKRATIVLEEYAIAAFRSAKNPSPNALFKYMLNKDQVDGLIYMSMHLRDLAETLERGFNKAFGLEASA